MGVLGLRKNSRPALPHRQMWGRRVEEVRARRGGEEVGTPAGWSTGVDGGVSGSLIDDVGEALDPKQFPIFPYEDRLRGSGGLTRVGVDLSIWGRSFQ